MIMYYGDILSPNKTETPEGFLICKNVPIGRLGDMEYTAQDLEINTSDPGQKFLVSRTEDDLFSPEALASFEGKPVTDGHPPEDVTPDNWSMYAKGHVENVRRGAGQDADKMVADLYITDKILKDQIINDQKREVSSGYSCLWVPNDAGGLNQRNLRGNHVAVVPRGRAGPSVQIRDSIEEPEPIIKTERSKKRMAKKTFAESVLSLFAKAAKDEASVEETIAEAKDVLEMLPGEEKKEVVKVEEKVRDMQNEMPDMGKLMSDAMETVFGPWRDEINGRLKSMEERMAPISPRDEEEEILEEKMEEKVRTPEEAGALRGDMLAELEKELIGDSPSMEGAPTLQMKQIDEEEKVETKVAMDSATYKKAIAVDILREMAGPIGKIKDEGVLKQCRDSLAKVLSNFQTDAQPNSYAEVMKITQKAAPAFDAQPNGNDFEKYQEIYAQRNPHTRKEK